MASSAVALGVEEQFFFDILPDSYVTTEWHSWVPVCQLDVWAQGRHLLDVHSLREAFRPGRSHMRLQLDKTFHTHYTSIYMVCCAAIYNVFRKTILFCVY